MTGSFEKLNPMTLHQTLTEMQKDLDGIARNVEAVLSWIRRFEDLHPDLFMRDDGK